MSGIQSLVPTDPVPRYSICGKDVLSTEVVAISLIPAPAKEEYMIFTDTEFVEVLRSLDFLDTEPPTSAHTLNEYTSPIPNLLNVVQVERETTLKNGTSQDWVRSGTMEPVSPSSSIVPKPSSHEEIVLVAGKATAEHNCTSERKSTRAKSSSGRRTGGREEDLPYQQSRHDGGHERADGPSGKKFMGRGVRIDLMLERGQKPPTKRRRDESDDDEEGSTSRVGKRKRTH